MNLPFGINLKDAIDSLKTEHQRGSPQSFFSGSGKNTLKKN